MNSIDQKIVEMKFDNDQFESAVAQTMSTLDKFKDKLNFTNTEKGLDKLGKATSDYQYTLQDVGESLASLEKRFGAFGTIGSRILENLTDSAIGFVKNGLGAMVGKITQGGTSRAMNLEQARFQMEGILKDAERVNSVIYDDILPQLQGTPFSLDQAAVVIGQLIASGKKNSEQIQRATRGIAGLAAMTGHSFEDVGNVFTKVAGQGVIMTEELNQLSHYGINAAADLSNFYNMVKKDSSLATKQTLKDMKAIEEEFGEFTEGTIREAAKKRFITYGSMAAAMDVLYGAHAQKSTQMYTGALEDLNAALARVGAEPAALRLNFLRDAFNALVPAVDAANAVIKPFVNSSRESGDAFKDVETYVRPFKGSLAKKVQEAGWAFQSLFVQLDDNHEIVRATMDSYQKLGFEMKTLENGAHEFYETLEDGSTRVYDEKQAIMNPNMLRAITAGTQSFVNVVAALGKVLGAVAKGAREVFPKVTLEAVADMAESFAAFTQKLILGSNALYSIKWIAKGLFTPLALTVRTVIFVFKTFLNVVQSLYNIFKPLLGVVKSFVTALGRISAGFGNALMTIANSFRMIGDSITDSIGNSSIWANIQRVWSNIANALDKLAFKIEVFGVKAYDFLTYSSKIEIFSKAWEYLGKILNKIKPTITTMKDALGMMFNKVDPQPITNFISTIVDKIKELLNLDDSKLISFIGFLLSKSSTLGVLGTVIEVLSGAFGKLDGSISGFSFRPLSGLWRWLSEIGQISLSVFKDLAEGDFFVEFFKGISPAFRGLKEFEGNIQKQFLPTVKGLTAAVPRLFGLSTWGETLVAAGDKMKSGIITFAKFLGLLGSGMAADAGKGAAALGKGLGELSKSVGKDFGSFGEVLSGVFQKLGEGINNWMADADPNKIKRLVLSLAMFGTALYYLSTINQAAKTFRGLTTVFQVLTGAISALGRIANSISGIFIALRGAAKAVSMVVYMHAFAVALIGIAVAMLIISKIDPDRLMASGMIVAACIAGIAAIFGATALLAKHMKADTAKVLIDIAAVIGSVAVAVLAIAGALYVLSGIEKGLGQALGAIVAVVLMFGALMIFMEAIPTIMKRFDVFGSFEGNISKAAFALVGIAAGCKTMADAIVVLGAIPEEQLKQGLSAALRIMAMMSLFAVAASKSSRGLFSAGLGMVALAVAVKAIGGFVKSIKNLKPEQLANVKAAMDMVVDLIVSMSLMAGLLTVMGRVLGGASGFLGASGVLVVTFGGIWLVAESLKKLGTEMDADQLKRAEEALFTMLAVIGILTGISAVGGMSTAMSAAAMAALAGGIFLIAEALADLSQITNAELWQGLKGIAASFGSMLAAALALGEILDKTIDMEDAASLILIGAAMFLFAEAIALLASMPLDTLVVSVIAVIGTLAIAGAVMTAFAGISPGLLAVAAAFTLLGLGALFVGAGIFLLTLALSALIPLISTLDGIDKDKLAGGLNVLTTVAKGLSDALLKVAGGIVAIGAAILVLGIGLAGLGVGIALVGVGFAAAAVGVFLLSGSLIVLYETVAAFFPSVVKPLEEGLKNTVMRFFGTTTDMIDATVGVIQDGGDKINQEMESSTDEAGNTLNDKLAEYQEMLGTGTYQMGEDSMLQLEDGIMDNIDLPSSAFDLMFPKLSAIKKKLSQQNDTFVKDQIRNTSTGILSGKDSIVKSSNTVSIAGVKAFDRSSEAKTAGINVAKGFSQGLVSKLNLAAEAGRSIAQAAITAAKNKLDEHSPSRVFMQIGAFVGEGFVKGIFSTKNDVEAATSNVVVSSMSAVTEAMSACAAAFDADLDFTPTITPVVDLTNVRQGASGINDLFNQNGGIYSPVSGRLNVALATSGFEARREANSELNNTLNTLNKKLGGVTDAMNTRQLNVYNTIDGAADPSDFADQLVRSFRLNARTL